MNVKFYYAYKLFKDTMPIYPVYVLMFEAKGLSLSQISLLLSIWALAVVVFEVPTGVIADHWSRKNMLLLGGLSKAIGYITWFFADGFALFALGFILWGISESFCSGSEEALLFDNLKAGKQEDLFVKVYGKGNFYSGIGVAFSCLTGGFLTALLTYRGVLQLSVLFVIVSVLFVIRFADVNFFKAEKTDKAINDQTKPISTFVDASLLCLRNKQLLTTILMLVLVIGTAGLLDEYDPIIAKSYGLNLGMIGVWISIRYVLEAIGAKFAYLIMIVFSKIGFKNDFYMVSMLCLISGCMLLVFGLGKNIVFIPLYGFFYMLLSSAGVIQEEYIQKTIDGQGRSTVHSIISLFNNIYGIPFILLIALAFTETGIHLGIAIVSIYILVLSMILFFMYRIYNKKRTTG